MPQVGRSVGRRLPLVGRKSKKPAERIAQTG